MADLRQITKQSYLNDNCLCAIAIRTTGPCPGFHDLIEFAVTPLTPSFTPRRDIMPFSARVLPRYMNFTAPQVRSKTTLMAFLEMASDKEDVLLAFDRWYEKLGLGLKKRIYPLMYCWGACSPFLYDLFGTNFEQQQSILRDYVSATQARDIVTLANYWNDIAFNNQVQIPFAKQTLGWIAPKLGLDVFNTRTITLLQETYILASVYAKLCDFDTSIIPLPFPGIQPVDYTFYTEPQGIDLTDDRTFDLTSGREEEAQLSEEHCQGETNLAGQVLPVPEESLPEESLPEEKS